MDNDQEMSPLEEIRQLRSEERKLSRRLKKLKGEAFGFAYHKLDNIRARIGELNEVIMDEGSGYGDIGQHSVQVSRGPEGKRFKGREREG